MRAASLAFVAIAGALSAPVATAATLTLPLPATTKPLEVDVGGSLEFLDAERVQSSSPYENPQGKLRLRLSSDLSSRLRFVSSLTGTAGGTPRDPSGAGVYDFQHARQDVSPSLEIGEAYFEDDAASWLDLRVGLQKFAWGKLDTVQPNDLLNPLKYYDPLLEEENDRKVGVPAIAPTLLLPSIGALSDLGLTLVWAPIFVPYLFPDQDERWYPPLARAPPQSQVMGVTVDNETRFRNAPLPSHTLEHGTYAARLAGRVGAADFALYYFEGYDPAPALNATSRGFVRSDPESPQGLDARSQVDVFPEFDRIHAAGADAAFHVFGATLRVEGAYLFDRPYPHNLRDIIAGEQIGAVDPVRLQSGEEQEVPVTLAPVNVRLDSVEWGAGGDTFIGDTFVLLQANQTTLLHNHENLLISDFETRFSMTLRRGFFDERLKAELLGLYAMQGVAGVAHPRLTYAWSDHVEIRIGYVAIEGHENSIVGEFKRNDEGYVRARFLF
jgi:hypothetical protein